MPERGNSLTAAVRRLSEDVRDPLINYSNGTLERDATREDVVSEYVIHVYRENALARSLARSRAETRSGHVRTSGDPHTCRTRADLARALHAEHAIRVPNRHCKQLKIALTFFPLGVSRSRSDFRDLLLPLFPFPYSLGVSQNRSDFRGLLLFLSFSLSSFSSSRRSRSCFLFSSSSSVRQIFDVGAMRGGAFACFLSPSDDVPTFLLVSLSFSRFLFLSLSRSPGSAVLLALVTRVIAPCSLSERHTVPRIVNPGELIFTQFRASVA